MLYTAPEIKQLNAYGKFCSKNLIKKQIGRHQFDTPTFLNTADDEYNVYYHDQEHGYEQQHKLIRAATGKEKISMLIVLVIIIIIIFCIFISVANM